jgi:hypothetical protein
MRSPASTHTQPLLSTTTLRSSARPMRQVPDTWKVPATLYDCFYVSREVPAERRSPRFLVNRTNRSQPLKRAHVTFSSSCWARCSAKKGGRPGDTARRRACTNPGRPSLRT